MSEAATELREVVEDLEATPVTIPTDRPESDGTLAWASTTMVVVRIRAGGTTGLGWTYAHSAVAQLIETKLKETVLGWPVADLGGAWLAMVRSLRNDGVPGLPMMAVSAVDTALWDLWARLCGRPLADMFSPVRRRIPIYGSGGFTSYDDETLAAQLSGWTAQGIPSVKMKIGRHPKDDPRRVRVARKAIGGEAALFVDANGAYRRGQAADLGQLMAAESGITWYEEPVSSDDPAGLRYVREHTPARLEVAAGEYIFTRFDALRLLEGGAVDCLQLDATRCGGFTGFLQILRLAEAYQMPVSAHCAPNLHAHVSCAVSSLRPIEYFHDHVRIEGMLLEGALRPREGCLEPDRTLSGHGLRLKEDEFRRYAI